MIENVQGDEKRFQLRPFSTGILTGKLSISGSLARTADTLVAEYRVQGALENIKLPAASSLCRRRHELWRHTCFELFFGIKGVPAYREINLSPSGAWNVYQFSAYRTGMNEDASVGQPLCRVATAAAVLVLNCSICLNNVIDDAAALEVGVSSVIETTDGTLSYWAIAHSGRQPDFHYRPDFLITLPPLGTPAG